MNVEKIDRRRHYLLGTDTETANTLLTEKGGLDMSCVLPYDCGWAICDTHGNIYRERSFVNADIFLDERDLMTSAYYAKKIPQYWKEIKSGERILTSTFKIRQTMLNDIKDFNIKEVFAHNARFDYNAYNNIQRWTTKSKYRYWFPKDIEIWDTMKMAQSVVAKTPTYIQFCEEQGLMTKNGRPRVTAEALYRYISRDTNFSEAHMGLEDVRIEVAILAYCYRKHKAMNKKLWAD